MGRISKGIMGDGDRLAPDEELSLGGGIPSPRSEMPPAGDSSVEDSSGGDSSGGDSSAGYDLVEEIAGYSAQIAHLEATRLKAIADLWSSDDMRPLSAPLAARNESDQKRRALRHLDRDDLTRAELMARLNLRAWDARRLIETATTLTRRFPRTLEALSQGQLDLTRASIIGEIGTPLADDRYDLALSTGLSPEVAEQQASSVAGLLEDHILKRAPHQGPDNLRACLHRAVNRLDPGYADRHAKDTLKARQVTHRTRRGESTGELYACLGAAEAQAVYNVIDSYARATRSSGSKRGLNELRADTLTHLVIYGHLPDGSTIAHPTHLDTENATIVPTVDPNTGDIHRPTTETAPPSPEHSHPTADHEPNPTADHHPNPTADHQPPPDSAPCASSDRSEPSGSGAGPSSERGTSGNSGDEAASDSHPAAGNLATGCQSRCAGGLYSRSGIRAQVQIVVGLETLLGLDDEPAELAGHGPITAATARDLAFGLGSTWRRLVTDPVTGYLLDYGRKTYRPPAALADHVRARDLTCRTPNCLRPATKCDLDHVISWPAGATSEQNLQAKCDLDHRLKHEGRWRHQMSTDPAHPPGTVVMVSPTGHVYLSHQHSYLDSPLNRPEPPEQSASPVHRRPPRDDDPGDPPF